MVNNNLYNYFADMRDKDYMKRKPFSIFYLAISLVFIYVIIFEFTWVTQNILPKPSVLVDSFFSLWRDYNLFGALVETTVIIFPVLAIMVLIFEILIKYLILLIDKYSGILNISLPFKYISFFVFALLFNLLFENSFAGEIIFTIFFIFGKLLNYLEEAHLTKSEEYIDAAKSLGVSKSKLISKVIWKNIKPKFYSHLTELHSEIWIIVIVYEFIGGTIGIGSIYKLAYIYNDFVAIIALGLFISLIIFTVNCIIKYFVSKIIFWQ